MGGQSVWRTGAVDIEAVLFGDGRSLGILTGNEIFWVHTDASSGLVTTRRELSRMQYALPVRGKGAPSLLALTENGTVRWIGERGEQQIQGSLADPRSGRFVDARLQARWDANGRLHIAKQAWLESLDSIQYSVIDGGALHSVGEIQRGGFREPFAEYVEMHFVSRHFQRSSWIQSSIGREIDLRDIDPDADVDHAKFAWTGKVFLFAYPTLVPNPSKLRVITAQCQGRATKPG